MRSEQERNIRRRTLIVGSGLLGEALGRHLSCRGESVLLSSRALRPLTGEWRPFDACNRVQYKRVITDYEPHTVILVHGPSDITWCEKNGAAAWHAHTTIAAHTCELASAAKIVLVSTDNVFSGAREVNVESDEPRPCNRYGAAKRAAEELILHRKGNERSLVVRVSLVYGWQYPGTARWLNYFTLAALRLLDGLSIAAPDDHWNTPVTVSDFVRVIGELLKDDACGVFHLGGPDRVSRFEWAQAIADVFECEQSLVCRIPRAQTRYACRPRNATLASIRLHELAGITAIEPAGVREAARRLRTECPSWISDRGGREYAHAI